MKELFFDCLRALKNYTGLRPFFALVIPAFVYLFLKEKNRSLRAVFLYMPLITGAVFLCPLTLKIYEMTGLDRDTYYRILWIIPFGLMAVYAAVRVMGKYKIAGVIIASALMVLSGRFIYTSPILYPSENIYGLPQCTLDIVDYLRSIDDHQRITVLPSSSIITSIRQYDADILMPYGRDMFNPILNYTHPVYDAFEKKSPIEMEELIEVSREYEVQYYIIYEALLTDMDPEEAGLTYLTTIDDHRIYVDPVMTERIAEIDRYYRN